MSSPLPPNMALTTVRGRYGAWSTDTVPVFLPWVGMNVTFSPAYPFVTNMTSTPSPVVVATMPRTFRTDASGYLSDIQAGFDGSGNGLNRNCQIVSSDDPDINPHDWKYLVTFLGPGSSHFRAFRTPAPAGAVVDMAIITPQRVQSGTTPTTAEVAAANAAASAAAAESAVASLHRGQAGGVAALDADGDVNNAAGVKILAGGGGGGSGSSTLAGITDMSATARLFNAALTAGHATTQAEMRAAIGAGTGSGTSNVVVGVSAGQAADGAATAAALTARALDSAVLHKTGDETKDGILTLSSSPVIPPGTVASAPVTKAQLDAVSIAGGAASWTTLTGKPTTFPPTPHTHVVADLTDISTNYVKQTASTADVTVAVAFVLRTTNPSAVRPALPTYAVGLWDLPGTIPPVNMGANDLWLA